LFFKTYISRADPVSGGGLDRVLEFGLGPVAGDDLREGGVPGDGDGGSDGQENKDDSGKIIAFLMKDITFSKTGITGENFVELRIFFSINPFLTTTSFVTSH
jgi:hypothetical protein